MARTQEARAANEILRTPILGDSPSEKTLDDARMATLVERDHHEIGRIEPHPILAQD